MTKLRLRNVLLAGAVAVLASVALVRPASAEPVSPNLTLRAFALEPGAFPGLTAAVTAYQIVSAYPTSSESMCLDAEDDSCGARARHSTSVCAT